MTKLFQERLQAWKHACGYLEEYITATEKLQLNQAKEYEKVLKVCVKLCNMVAYLLTMASRPCRRP